MRRLMLLRHAKTERDAPSGQDRDRRLEPRGIAEASEIATWLAHKQLAPQMALVSDATRARQTWDLIAPSLPAVAFEERPELYGAEAGELLRVVHSVEDSDPESLLLLGHNPGLHEFALMLIGSGEITSRNLLGSNLPTAGIVLIDFDSGNWGDVSFRRGRLAAFATPKSLRGEFSPE